MFAVSLWLLHALHDLGWDGQWGKAAESSSLVSGIFQRMIVSGMDPSRAVRTINQLVHSDTYATLDAVCVDTHKGSAYLVKSAACPTLLLRGMS